MAGRIPFLIYGALAYGYFFATFIYLIGFVGAFDWLLPKTIDTGNGSFHGGALAIDLSLVGLFAVQHTVMARPAFKASWTKIVPKPIERSTYVLFSSAVLTLLYWQWRPMTEPVWDIRNPAGVALLWTLFGAGWVIVLISTFLLDHFELFGLKQVWLHYVGRSAPHSAFITPLFYRYSRHPLMLGFLIAMWSTPRMTVGHLAFSAAFTVYILAAIQVEERDLVGAHGAAYEAYQRSVSMLVPLPSRRLTTGGPPPGTGNPPPGRHS